MSAISHDFPSGERLQHLAAESRLDSTRDELRRLFMRDEADDAIPESGRFPRSKILRTLTKGHTAVTILAIGAGGLLLMKPRLLRAVVRAIPMGALFKFAIARFMTRK